MKVTFHWSEGGGAFCPPDCGMWHPVRVSPDMVLTCPPASPQLAPSSQVCIHLALGPEEVVCGPTRLLENMSGHIRSGLQFLG